MYKHGILGTTMDGFTPTQAWYKTTAGRIFVWILAFVSLGLLGFGSLVLYYTYQISQGNITDIESALRSSRFTVASALGQEGVPPTADLENVNNITHPHTPTLGEVTAPVTIVMFIDFECPFCQQSYPITKQVFETYGPVVRVIYKHFPLASIHPLSYRAGVAASCANDQGKFWEVHNQLFEQRDLSEAALTRYGDRAGLNMQLYENCRTSGFHETSLDTDLQDGIALGVRGTPTYFVNGQRVEGVLTRDQWDTVILNALEQQ